MHGSAGVVSSSSFASEPTGAVGSLASSPSWSPPQAPREAARRTASVMTNRFTAQETTPSGNLLHGRGSVVDCFIRSLPRWLPTVLSPLSPSSSVVDHLVQLGKRRPARHDAPPHRWLDAPDRHLQLCSDAIATPQGAASASRSPCCRLPLATGPWQVVPERSVENSAEEPTPKPARQSVMSRDRCPRCLATSHSALGGTRTPNLLIRRNRR